MNDSTRARINTAFEEELGAAPVPAGLRALSIRGAVTAGRPRAPHPALLALVAAVVMMALVVTLVVGSNALRHNPTPSRSRPAPSALPPSPRSGANLVYDAAHGELVLFGGLAGPTGGPVNETWTWDGKVWRQYHLSVAPAPRASAAMAYDEVHRNVLLFGGADVSGRGDTWSWDGSAWKALHPAHEPSFNSILVPSMQFDAASRKVLLYGFKTTVAQGLSNTVPEMWSWDGADWTLVSGAPSLGSAAGTAVYPSVGDLLTYGGHVYLVALEGDRVGGHYVSDMWRWDETTWTLSATFPQRFFAFPVEDQRQGDLLAFDGDTWTFDGATWTRKHPKTVPPTTGYVAYFPPLHEVVMWGDVNGAGSNAIWAWDGADWKQMAAGTMPTVVPPPGTFGPDSPEAAAAFIRQTVKTASPVLLPTSLPAGLEASGTATADFFSVDYKSDQRDRVISFAIAVANPPPGDDRSADTRVTFRHALAPKFGTNGQADYFVYDRTVPRSDRWLMWTEPGRSNGSVIGTDTGVPYFLYASGLTDSEFWQVANSLR